MPDKQLQDINEEKAKSVSHQLMGRVTLSPSTTPQRTLLRRVELRILVEEMHRRREEIERLMEKSRKVTESAADNAAGLGLDKLSSDPDEPTKLYFADAR